MLIEFSVENFRSVADEQTLSMVASSRIKELDGNTFAPEGLGGLHLLESAAIFGANGAGKSNICKALGVMQRIVAYSSTGFVDGSKLPIQPFRLGANSEVQPSRFEAMILVDGKRYQYGFSATREAIVEEWLFAYPSGRMQVWFERGPEVEGEVRFGPALKGDKHRLFSQTRPNALFLSVAGAFKHSQLSPIYTWFSRTLHPLWSAGAHMGPDFARLGARSTASESRDNETLRKRVASWLRSADTGIVEYRVDREHQRLPEELVSAISPDLRDKIPASFDVDRVRTMHIRADGEPAWFELNEESTGTQALFEFLGPWLEAIDNGLVLVVDEEFCNLHPHLTRLLLRQFHAKVDRTSPAQLIFTTHDTSLLDGLLRRDQVYIVEKDSKGRTLLSSIQDLRLRKDTALSKNYLAGRLGGVPFLGKDGR